MVVISFDNYQISPTEVITDDKGVDIHMKYFEHFKLKEQLINNESKYGKFIGIKSIAATIGDKYDKMQAPLVKLDNRFSKPEFDNRPLIERRTSSMKKNEKEKKKKRPLRKLKEAVI